MNMMYHQDYFLAAMLVAYVMITEYPLMKSFVDYELGAYE